MIVEVGSVQKSLRVILPFGCEFVIPINESQMHISSGVDDRYPPISVTGHPNIQHPWSALTTFLQPNENLLIDIFLSSVR